MLRNISGRGFRNSKIILKIQKINAVSIISVGVYCLLYQIIRNEGNFFLFHGGMKKNLITLLYETASWFYTV